jgi:hypothetical protein
MRICQQFRPFRPGWQRLGGGLSLTGTGAQPINRFDTTITD